MCGIFGFTGSSDRPSATVVEGLKELEYRGYDSWGVAMATGDGVVTEKRVGKISDAHSSLPAAHSGLGHTRWATHGGVTEANAHPQTDCDLRLALIHNGIVENHADLKSNLSDHTFNSQTDTEAVVHLLEDELARSRVSGEGALVRALMNSFPKLSGLSAVAVLDGQTGEIAAAKNGSPLVVGVGENSSFLASDPAALLPHTRKLIFLDDGQAVSLTLAGPRVFQVDTGTEIEPAVRSVNWTIHERDLGLFDHYMLKEINEQPQVLRNLETTAQADVEGLAQLIRNASEVIITGCGTAHNAAMAAQYLFASIAGRRVSTVMASEMPVVEPVLRPGALVIALSQSGETIDVLDAVRLAQDRGATVAALTNSEGSTLHRLANHSVLLQCGPERCVLATKTYVAKLAVLLMAAYSLAGKGAQGRRLVAEAAMLMESRLIDEVDRGSIDEIAAGITGAGNVFVLGRNIAYPLGLEAALKIKEVSYIHAEGFASGELKHGVIALVEEGTPCLIFAMEPQTLRATLAGASEVAARGALTIGFSHEPHPEFGRHVAINGTDEAALFEITVCFQLLAYRLAVRLGRDPDRPRNLAKSVTVR